MGRIRYVCVSDMHAGTRMSLATAEAVSRGRTEGTDIEAEMLRQGVMRMSATRSETQDDRGDNPVSPVAHCFGEALSALLEHHNRRHYGRERAPEHAPTMILLGDALDLAFASRRHSSDSYVYWLGALDPKRLAGQGQPLFQPAMFLIPGNHDHSLWTGARLAAEAETAARSDYTGLPPCTTSTDIGDPAGPNGFGGTFRSPLMSRLNAVAGYDGGVWVRYPNMTILPDAECGPDTDPEAALVLHHGHFCEFTYTAMSALHDALTGFSRDGEMTVEELSIENANWINFGWSSFGESRRLSRDVASMYEDLLSTTEAHFLRDRFSIMLSDMLLDHAPMGGDANFRRLVRFATAAAVDVVFGSIGDAERSSQLEVLTPAGVASVRNYIDGPVRRQLTQEIGRVPEKMSFIFGHTHKPFADALVPGGEAPIVHLCNIGGWYLDSARLDSREGASVLLIDENLNAVTVSLFRTPRNDEIDPTEVRLVTPTTASGRAFRDEIAEFVDLCEAEDPERGGGIDLWRRLSLTAVAEYRARQRLILERIERDQKEATAKWRI